MVLCNRTTFGRAQLRWRNTLAWAILWTDGQCVNSRKLVLILGLTTCRVAHRKPLELWRGNTAAMSRASSFDRVQASYLLPSDAQKHTPRCKGYNNTIPRTLHERHGNHSLLVDMTAVIQKSNPAAQEPRSLHRVGMKFFESLCCSLQLSGNAAMPATMPAAMNSTEMMDQVTPQHWLEPP